MIEHTPDAAPMPAPESDFAARAEHLIDTRQAQAETAAMLGDDSEVAQSLQAFMAAKLQAEGRAMDGTLVPDEEREDSADVLATKKAAIENLNLTPDGTLSPDGKELVDAFRAGTREVVADVAMKGDTEWLTAQYGPERGQAQIDKYKKLARDYLQRPAGEQ